MPSNRDLNNSKRSIDSVINYISQNNNFEFTVSDNSNDINKKDKYSSNTFSNFNYLFNPNISESENWFNSSKNSTGHFIGFIGDDDYLISVGPSCKYEKGNKIIGYRPNFVVWEEGKGILKTTNFNINQLSAKDRVVSYFNNCNGNNNSLFSFIRSDISKSLSVLCKSSHPLKNSGYYDWAVVLAYVSSGFLLQDNSSVYIYDNRNWSGTTEDIDSKIKNLFKKDGLDDRGNLFLFLLLALDSFILIGRKSSPVDRHELFEAAQFTLVSYANAFFDFYLKNQQLYLHNEQLAINDLKNLSQPLDVMNQLLKILETYNESLIDPYLFFYRSSVELDWGYF